MIFLIERKNTAVHHRFRFFKTGKSFVAAAFCQSDRIANPGICHFFDIGDDIANFAGGKLFSFIMFQTQVTDFFDGIFGFCGKEFYRVINTQNSFEHADQDDHSAIFIKIRIKYQSFGWKILISGWSRNVIDNSL